LDYKLSATHTLGKKAAPGTDVLLRLMEILQTKNLGIIEKVKSGLFKEGGWDDYRIFCKNDLNLPAKTVRLLH